MQLFSNVYRMDNKQFNFSSFSVICSNFFPSNFSHFLGGNNTKKKKKHYKKGEKITLIYWLIIFPALDVVILLGRREKKNKLTVRPYKMSAIKKSGYSECQVNQNQVC